MNAPLVTASATTKNARPYQDERFHLTQLDESTDVLANEVTFDVLSLMGVTLRPLYPGVVEFEPRSGLWAGHP